MAAAAMASAFVGLPEDVRDEMELLREAYGEAFAWDEARGEASVTIRCGRVGCAAVINVQRPGYPEETAAGVEVKSRLGLSDAELLNVLEAMRRVADEYVGMPAAYACVLAGKEALEEINARPSLCAVCMSDIAVEGDLFAPPCAHAFHRRCFAQWVQFHDARSRESTEARAAERSVEAERRAAAGSLRGAEDRVEAASRAIETAQTRCAECEALLVSTRASLESAKAALPAARGRAAVSSARDLIQQLEDQVKQQDKDLAARRQVVVGAERAAEEAMRRLDDERRVAEDRLAAAVVAERDKDTPCPTCGQIIPAALIAKHMSSDDTTAPASTASSSLLRAEDVVLIESQRKRAAELAERQRRSRKGGAWSVP